MKLTEAAGKLRDNPILRQTVKNIFKAVNRSPKVTSSEPLSRDFLVEVINNDCPVILDIGCNDGTHSLWFLELFSEGSVYAFEPDPRACKRFHENINDDRIQLFNLAISSTNGFVDFYMSDGRKTSDSSELLPEGWDLSGSIRKPKNHLVVHPWCTFDQTIQVETKTLDTWFVESGIDLIDLVWADVQGAERDLIEGATNTFKKTRFLYTEYNDFELYEGQITLKKILELLPDFEAVQVYERDVLLKNKNL
jgi:2-O-methyltransferase